MGTITETPQQSKLQDVIANALCRSPRKCAAANDDGWCRMTSKDLAGAIKQLADNVERLATDVNNLSTDNDKLTDALRNQEHVCSNFQQQLESTRREQQLLSSTLRHVQGEDPQLDGDNLRRTSLSELHKETLLLEENFLEMHEELAQARASLDQQASRTGKLQAKLQGQGLWKERWAEERLAIIGSIQALECNLADVKRTISQTLADRGRAEPAGWGEEAKSVRGLERDLVDFKCTISRALVDLRAENAVLQEAAMCAQQCAQTSAALAERSAARLVAAGSVAALVGTVAVVAVAVAWRWRHAA